jgi:very-short-patch-repair endonuclease
MCSSSIWSCHIQVLADSKGEFLEAADYLGVLGLSAILATTIRSMSLQIRTHQVWNRVEFAGGQAVIPLIESLELVNEGEEAHEGLVLELSSSLPFFERKIWKVQPIGAKSISPVSDTHVKLEPGFFLRLSETTDAEIWLRLTKGDETLINHTHSVTLVAPEPELSLIYDHSINYAFQQNSIPIIKELRLQNNGIKRRDVIVRFTTEPDFASPFEIRLQTLEPGEEFRQSPPELKLKLSPDFLAGLHEKVAGWIKVEMIEGGTVVQSIVEQISLLARNEWCGMSSLPEILAAFVLPNDPTVTTILSRSSEILKEATGRSSLNAYQDKSRKRAWEQIAAIYKAISELGIRYIVAPASFEKTGQKLRLPSDIVSQRFGNCLDLSLLFAACCEQAGLRPFVFIQHGHAYAGCWLEERSLPEPASDDLQQIRKLETDDLVTVFESTMLAGEQPGTLNHSELVAKPHLIEDKLFCFALDIHAARTARIHPLPIPGQAPLERVSEGSKHTGNASDGIGDREITEVISISQSGPVKPTNRIDLWKSRLLDLSLRNRLLNLRETKATIRILAEPNHVEDELADERELSLRAKPKMMSENDPRNAAIYTHEQRADALKDHLKDELEAGRIHTNLDESEHDRRLTELFRSARTALEENGTNTLFAAVGILEWRETEHSDRVHRAPLLLMPVELKRKSVLEGFSIRRIDEETRLNVTLMEMLKQNFRKEIPGLDPLPEDEKGIDVPRVLRIFRDAVRELPGWEVQSEVWLGQFSFTKFLLWKDLTDRLEDLTKNRIVRHLIHEAGTQIQNPAEDIQASELDDRYHPKQILCPRSADSSQLAAVMAAADGHDFVLEGPPGTGKSQTITNIIAHCLAVGKRVLFVAEKRAALDVVHRRLREDGLEPFCLELHSNKTGKKEVLEQFDTALKFAEESQITNWEHRAGEMDRLRISLNSYTRALHKRTPCGLSAYHCLDYLLPRGEEPTVRFDVWREILATDLETLEQARQLAKLMQERSRSLMPLADHALTPLECEDWSPGWAERCEELNALLLEHCRGAVESTQELTKWMQFNRPLNLPALKDLDALVAILLTPEPVGPAFATTPLSQLAQTLQTYRAWIEERAKLRSELSRIQVPRESTSEAVICESFSAQTAGEVFRKGKELETRLDECRGAARVVLDWFMVPQITQIPLDRLIKFSSLARILLEIKDVGPSFPLAPWDVWSLEINRWIALVRERNDIRKELSAYSEASLLALDLDSLKQKCAKAQSSWFLPKLLNMNAVKKALRSALPPKAMPEVEKMGGIVEFALRLRGVNSELNSVRESAEAMLAGSWKSGEPDIDTLTEIHNWGGDFHRRFQEAAGSDGAWTASVQTRLAESVQKGAQTLRAGSQIGDEMSAFCERLAAFNEGFTSFAEQTSLNRAPIDDAEEYFSAAEHVLKAFLDAAPRLLEINTRFDSEGRTGESILGVSWNRGEPSTETIDRISSWGERLHSRILAFAGEDIGWLGGFRNLLSSLFTEGPAIYAPGTPIGDRMQRFRESLGKFISTLEQFSAETRLRDGYLNSATDYLTATRALVERVGESWPNIRAWCLWQRIRKEAINLGLAPLVQKLESPDDTDFELGSLFERSFRKSLFFAILETEPILREFLGSEHDERIERFRNVDEHLSKLSRELIRARLAAGIPRDKAADEIPREEIGLLKRELGKRMRHIPVRQLIGRIPTLLPRLKPCVLMSPLSVAQYLEASHESFDVVIFDEASQIPVWDSIGAIARGRQLIIVGDPKQLPPTSFFASNSDDDDDRTPDEHKDLESILDELMTHGLRHKRLQWHYRSRHESLITFSNRQYYENSLLTFPSPETEIGGVRFRNIPAARYDKGKSRTNRLEAEALVQELISRLQDPKGSRKSYGVVTFSQAQQALIENLLDEERRKYPDIERHFGDEPPVEGEPVFVKNLENVQGDERDIILFSICYGMDEAGKLSMNFGPLNRDGGERRLNVAVTRAKHEVIVFSGLRGDQIDLTRTQSRGVRDLKYFLEYAERGPRALVAATTASALSDPDSEFEKMVADRIRSAGFDVHHQVGCSGYRIDLAVLNPKSAGRYLLGIECDGATYHRAATARDRDKLRQAVLEDLGWKLHRIWSTDWWHDADAQMRKLLDTLHGLVESDVEEGVQQ